LLLRRRCWCRCRCCWCCRRQRTRSWSGRPSTARRRSNAGTAGSGLGSDLTSRRPAGCSWDGRPSTARPTDRDVGRRSAGTGCSRATASSSGSTPPPPGKTTCTASTNSATSPTIEDRELAERQVPSRHPRPWEADSLPGNHHLAGSSSFIVYHCCFFTCI